MSTYNHADDTVQFLATRVYNAPGQGCTTAATYSDVIFSHTCPERYTPVECFLPMIDQSTVDRSTEEWLGEIEASIEYRAWYCGHWHINKRIDKMHFLHETFEML